MCVFGRVCVCAWGGGVIWQLGRYDISVPVNIADQPRVYMCVYAYIPLIISSPGCMRAASTWRPWVSCLVGDFVQIWPDSELLSHSAVLRLYGDLNWRCNHYHLFWHCMTLIPRVRHGEAALCKCRRNSDVKNCIFRKNCKCTKWPQMTLNVTRSEVSHICSSGQVLPSPNFHSILLCD